MGEKEYEVPIGSKDRQNDLFYIKKALNGDREAREMFLGGEDERIFYIGEHSAKWLTITKTNQFVTEL